MSEPFRFGSWSFPSHYVPVLDKQLLTWQVTTRWCGETLLLGQVEQTLEPGTWTARSHNRVAQGFTCRHEAAKWLCRTYVKSHRHHLNQQCQLSVV